MHRVVSPPGAQADMVRYSLVYFSRPEHHVKMHRLQGGLIDEMVGSVGAKAGDAEVQEAETTEAPGQEDTVLQRGGELAESYWDGDSQINRRSRWTGTSAKSWRCLHYHQPLRYLYIAEDVTISGFNKIHYLKRLDSVIPYNISTRQGYPSEGLPAPSL